jgi:phosphatidylserine/phosphatidylglycerophosphate/cardiolipin synthase-like enzyme
MNNIQTEILNDIRNARQSVKVAVSWLTDILLINELLLARRRGLEIKIVVSNNELNIIRFELFQNLLAIGADVRKEGTENPENGDFMHYKFYIIDDKFAKSGSYNWSANAMTNREKLDPVPLEKSLKEFQACYLDGVNFFHNLENPERKRAELALIEKEHKDALTPEKLAAYRQIQVALIEQEIRHKKELVEKENQLKAAEFKTKQEKDAREKLLSEQRAKEQQSQYGIKQDAPPVSEAPPRSYANE